MSHGKVGKGDSNVSGGHQPHDAWVLLHALKRRDSLAEQVGGWTNWLKIGATKIDHQNWGNIFSIGKVHFGGQ